MIRQLVSETVQEKAYQAIKNSIVRNELLPGESLSIDELARILGVSQTPVREALARLSVEGLVERAPNRTAIVSTIELDDIHQAYEVRKLLEPYAVKCIAERLHTHPEIAESLTAIKDAASEILAVLPRDTASIETRQYAACQEIDLQLQELMVTTLADSLSGRVLAMVGNYSLRMRSLAILGLHSQDIKTLRSILIQHLAIIDALLEENEAAAVSAVTEHLLSAEARTIEALHEAEATAVAHGTMAAPEG